MQVLKNGMIIMPRDHNRTKPKREEFRTKDLQGKGEALMNMVQEPDLKNM